MRLETCLQELGRRWAWQQCKQLRSMIGLDWVTAALRCTDTLTIRRRKLPNEAVVWLVVGMAYRSFFSIFFSIRGCARRRPGWNGAELELTA